MSVNNLDFGEHIQFSVKKRFGIITLDRIHRSNAFTQDQLENLKKAIEYCQEESKIRGIILTNNVSPAPSVHNVYFLILAEFGLLGFLPFILYLISIVSVSIKTYKLSEHSFDYELIICFLSILCAYLFACFFDKLVYAKVHNFLFILFGFLSSQYYYLSNKNNLKHA